MRIALYNWAPMHDAPGEGGGVAVYLRNLAVALAALGHEVTVLSGGFVYDVLSRKVFLRQRKARDAHGIAHVDIVNSRVLAPSFLMFARVETATSDAETRAAVESFLRDHGPFEVFHIQNVEGIPWDVFSLRKRFPGTKFILSNHNFHAVCQQVNLWHQDRERCVDYRGGAGCFNCNIFEVEIAKILASRIASGWQRGAKSGLRGRFALPAAYAAVRLRKSWLRDYGVSGTRAYLSETLGPGKPPGPPASKFAARRRAAIEMLNTYCDAVISVSKAVEDILVDYGIAPEKSVVRYIGTRHFTGEVAGRAWDDEAGKGVLRLGFLGYTRPDKGFQFLVSALEALPAATARRLALVFAGQVTDPAAMGRLRSLENRLAGLTIIEGYRQEELPKILAGMDLGIVPPLWDDALPQVAIEFICHGVPILVSDRGGSQEIAADPAFVFKAGKVDAFITKLQAILAAPELTRRFWQAPRPLRTMAAHVEELLSLYQGEQPAPVALPAERVA